MLRFVFQSSLCHVWRLLLFSCEAMSNSFEIPKTVAHQAPLSLRFSRQEYWSALPFLSRSVQFSCSVVSDILRPHESQHARPPCPSPTARVYSNSCPLSWQSNRETLEDCIGSSPAHRKQVGSGDDGHHTYHIPLAVFKSHGHITLREVGNCGLTQVGEKLSLVNN